MRICITGANGFLGFHLCQYFNGLKSYEVFATGRGNKRWQTPFEGNYTGLDLCDTLQLTNYLQAIKPAVIIHTAAMSKPNECDANKRRCLQYNLDTTETIINLCKQLNIKLIYTSTDFIFGSDGLHSETSIAKPINFYGETKLLAEKSILQALENYCIVRPVFIYGAVTDGIRPTFIQWIADSLKQHKTIQVVNDQYRTPTFVVDICKAIETMIALHKKGIYHIAGDEIITPYNLAISVANLLKLDASYIEAVTEANFKEPVQRAKNAILSISKAQAELNYTPTQLLRGLKKSLQIDDEV